MFFAGLMAFASLSSAQAAISMPLAFWNLAPTNLSEVDTLQQSSNRESCDLAYADKMVELAQGLDAREPEIQKYIAADTNPVDYLKVDWGVTQVLISKNKCVPATGWKKLDPYGWRDAYDTYSKLEKTDVSKDPIAWTNLAYQVSSLLLKDYSRIVGSSNMYLDQNSGPMVSEIHQFTTRCQEGTCDPSSLSKRATDFILKNPIYSSHWAKIQDQDETARAEAIKIFHRQMKRDLSEYSPYRNESVTRVDQTTFELPLDPGPFVKVKDRLQAVIEDMWKSSKFKVRVRWVEQKDVPGSFIFLLDPKVGPRGYVLTSKKIIQLYGDTLIKTIQHEIGHVLGLPDRYYEVWDPKACRYVYYYNLSSLMSDHCGTVTDEDWAALDALYPYSGPVVPEP